MQTPIRAEGDLRDCFVGVTEPKGQENSSPDEDASLPLVIGSLVDPHL